VTHVVVVGAGMGGLAGALRLAHRGFRVTVIEARADVGGLASGVTAEGFDYDAGPYILLDRPGLEWAFHQLSLDIDALDLRRVEDVYEVQAEGQPPVRFKASLAATAAGFEEHWPGSGARYEAFVNQAAETYRHLQPMLFVSKPGPLVAIRSEAWKEIPFVLRSLGRVLRATGLPQPIIDAIGIWTHVAGQRMERAPSPLGFVPALIHKVGCYVPSGGIRSIPAYLRAACAQAGVEFRCGQAVSELLVNQGRATGVTLASGDKVKADAVISNTSALTTYLELLPTVPHPERLQRLPLQSPGACAYLAIKDASEPPYLRFLLPHEELCRLLVRPGVVNPELAKDGWTPARLISPMKYETVETMDRAAQEAHLERLLEEAWWRHSLQDARVVAKRIPLDWGTDYHLYRNSMNPVMTASFMRSGRIAHRSPHAAGLYLCGSSTHPGQWVSFCAISGILAADCLAADVG
jgi:phytoene dehydrogenase-like protein